MSIALMTRVFEQSEPHEAADRLMLLALADNANDQGVCWPSIPTLARKCAVHRSTVMRTLERLEACGHVEVDRVAGRVNRYHVLGGTRRVGATGRVDATGAVHATGGVDATGTRRVGATPPVASARPEPSGTQKRTPSSSSAREEPASRMGLVRVGPVQEDAAAGERMDGLAPLRGVLQEAVESLSRPVRLARGEMGAVARLLSERGIEGTVPVQLVQRHGDAAVLAAVAEWDRRRAEGRTVGPGLLVTLVREGVGASPASPLLTYAEMLAACDRDGKRTSDYEAVPVDGETKPLWRRRPSGQASTEGRP